MCTVYRAFYVTFVFGYTLIILDGCYAQGIHTYQVRYIDSLLVDSACWGLLATIRFIKCCDERSF